MKRPGLLLAALGLGLAGGCTEATKPPPLALAPLSPGELGVVYSRAERRSIADTVRLLGEVQVAAGGDVVIPAPALATVVAVRDRGVRVERGESLARVRTSLPPPPEQVDRLSRLRAEAERDQLLARDGLVPRAEVETALGEVARLERILAARSAEQRVLAPFAGYVSEVSVRPGQTVEGGAPLLRLLDPARLEVTVQVPEPFAALLAPGARATIAAGATPAPATAIAAVASRLGDAVDRPARTLEVAFALPAGATLLPGMRPVVELETGPRHEAVVVPREALVLRGGRLHVVVQQGEMGHLRAVRAGARAAGFVEITTGLAAGESVAVAGTSLCVAPGAFHSPGASLRMPTWLQVPAGRGANLAARLGTTAFSIPDPLPARATIDARALALHGIALGPLLRRMTAPDDATAGTALNRLVHVAPARRFTARRWRPGNPAEAVDALPVAGAAPPDLLARARAIDLDAELWGTADKPARGRIPVAAAALALLFLATGSLRATALVGLAVLGITRLDRGPGPGLAATAPAIAALAVLAAGAVDREQRLRPAAALRAAAAAVLAALAPVALLLAALGQLGRSGATVLAAGLAAGAAVALLLALLLAAVPSAASFAPAPIERLPRPLLPGLVLLASLIAGGRGLAPPGIAVVPAGGAAFLSDTDLDRAIDALARRAADAGLDVLAAAAANGSVNLVLDGPRAAGVARALLAIAPPGLGLGLELAPAAASDPDSAPEPTRRLLGPAIAAEEASLGEALARGPAFFPGRTITLADPGEAWLLPLAGADGAPVFLGEWSEPPTPAVDLPPAPGFAGPPGRATLVWLALPAGLVAASAGAGAALKEWARGASRRRTRAAVRPVATRTAAACAAAAALAALDSPPATLGAALAVAWALALLVPAALVAIRGRARSR